METFHINPKILPPESVIGEVVNSIFAGSRLDGGKIVKQSHYDQGPVSVFKKVGEYLLGCERMRKQNVLMMLEEVETGNLREEVFWSVVEDLMLIKASHNLKTSKCSLKKSTSKSKFQSSSDLVPTNNHNIIKPISAKDQPKKQSK